LIFWAYFASLLFGQTEKAARVDLLHSSLARNTFTAVCGDRIAHVAVLTGDE
jgi:hypothetical protein